MKSETPEQLPKIGPFVLQEVVGQAGMGVVWRGMHVEQRVPVAVKFLTQEGARDPLYLGCLNNEVRKVASLEHPAIIQVHDHGEVPKNLGIETLIPGSPYLVMEFAEGGTLSRHCGHLNWEQIWRVLMRLLDGLAHAHARDVVHRDIKPGNILLRRSSGGVVLSDFGLARAGDTRGGAVLNAGTPSYMAPEQIRQHANDIGPWTDMYGLGCLAWSLVCGRPPFQSESIDGVLEAHLHQPIPKLAAETEVPPEFEQWVGKLLRKNPHHRFVRAADAAHVLSQMAQPDDEDTLYIEPVFDPNATNAMESASTSKQIEHEETTAGCEDTIVMDPRTAHRVQFKPSALPKVGKSMLWADRSHLPDFPDDWRDPHPPRQVRHLLGTGLALYGLRNFPVVGRTEEQNELWSLLKQVRDEQRTRCIVLEGADGTGKTHLSEWLARRAYEVGAAIVVRARFDAEVDDDPLIDIIRDLLSTKGLDREQAQEQVRSSLDVLGHHDDAEIQALMTVLGPFSDERYSSRLLQERHDIGDNVIRHLLHRFSVIRPMIVVLDDAHLNDDSLTFAKKMLEEQGTKHPVLLVINVNSVGMNDAFRKQLKSFSRGRRVERMRLGPLAKEDRPLLVRKLLGLEPTLAALVERRSGGNPQFAVQLVGDWIQKGLLVQGEGGFSFRKGIQPEFPADLQAIWERRLTAALPVDRDTRCLQLAAELGMEIDHDEWTEACDLAGIDIDESLIEGLSNSHLLVPESNGKGWVFTHSLVRESLKRRAEFEGLRVEHHDAVATMLANREGVEVRLGRHLYHAGRLEEAVEALLKGAERCSKEWRHVMGMDLLEMRVRALRELDVPKSDLRWAQGWWVRHIFHVRADNVSKGRTVLEKVLKCVEKIEEARDLRSKAWSSLGKIERRAGNSEEARKCYNRALQHAGQNEVLLAQTLDQLGTLEFYNGNLVLGTQYFEGALKYAEGLGDLHLANSIRASFAGISRTRGDYEECARLLNECLVFAREAGLKLLEARCYNDLAELDRFTGNLEAAEEGYRQSMRIHSAYGNMSNATIALLNLGQIYSQTGRINEARTELERALRAVQAAEHVAYEGFALVTLSYIYAKLNDMDAWEECFTKTTKIFAELQIVEVDVARNAELAAEVLLEAGHIDKARLSYEFARHHWAMLQRDDKVASLKGVIDGLSSGD